LDLACPLTSAIENDRRKDWQKVGLAALNLTSAAERIEKDDCLYIELRSKLCTLVPSRSRLLCYNLSFWDLILPCAHLVVAARTYPSSDLLATSMDECFQKQTTIFWLPEGWLLSKADHAKTAEARSHTRHTRALPVRSSKTCWRRRFRPHFRSFGSCLCNSERYGQQTSRHNTCVTSAVPMVTSAIHKNHLSAHFLAGDFCPAQK
jgi:hypothetical protein